MVQTRNFLEAEYEELRDGDSSDDNADNPSIIDPNDLEKSPSTDSTKSLEITDISSSSISNDISPIVSKSISQDTKQDLTGGNLTAIITGDRTD